MRWDGLLVYSYMNCVFTDKLVMAFLESLYLEMVFLAEVCQLSSPRPPPLEHGKVQGVSIFQCQKGRGETRG